MFCQATQQFNKYVPPQNPSFIMHIYNYLLMKIQGTMTLHNNYTSTLHIPYIQKHTDMLFGMVDREQRAVPNLCF